MPESEIAARIREGYLRANEGDYDTMMPLVTEDFELHRRLGGLNDGQVVRGRDAFRQYLEPDVFASMQNEILGIREVPGKVLVETRTTAVGAGSGVEMTAMSWQIWEHDSEQVHRVTLYNDRAEAEEAVGPSG
jgi:ketosteroid isomerase-like protein